jgi:anion-transporting  ArsA/GET3 family ATPase
MLRPARMALIDLLNRQLTIVTGKGGVGKSTLTAALGMAWARQGKRVLCAEITPDEHTPSRLAEAFGAGGVGDEPQEVFPNIDAVLVTPQAGHRRFLQDTLPLKLLADAAMRSSALKKFLAAAPGFSDMGVMYRMLDLMRRPGPSGAPRYDRVLLDSPATGHALALAQIPGMLLKVIPGGPIGRAAKEGQATLTDPSITGVLIVTLPETLPVTESLELKKGLEKAHMPVSAIVVNRVPKDPFTPEERASLQALLPTQGTVMGGRELRRIERADAALAMLKLAWPDAMVAYPELEEARSVELAQLMSLRVAQ